MVRKALPTSARMKDMSENQRSSHSHISPAKFIGLGALTLALGYCINLFLFSIYMVPSASMEPNLVEGDRYLVSKISYTDLFPTFDRTVKLSKIRRGDIIVFRNPEDLNTDYVKRVVALAGDLVKIENHNIYINGRNIKTSQSERDSAREVIKESIDGYDYDVLYMSTDKATDGNYEIRVPENSVFVLGDNRNHSVDSRNFGKVPLDYIIGKGVVILWNSPPEESGISSIFGMSRILKNL